MSAQHDRLIQEQFSRQAATFGNVHAHSDGEILDGMMRLGTLGGDDEVLDVACGPGLVACAVASRVRRVTGVDIVPAMLREAGARAQEQNLANVEWRAGDGRNLDFPENRFSRVLTRYSFHHLLEPRLTLAEMTRVCRAGGVVLVCDATPARAHQDAYNQWERLRDPSHAAALTLDQLLALAQDLPLEAPAVEEFRLDCALETILRASFPDPASAAAYREQLIADIGVDRLSVRAYRAGEEIRFSFPITIAAWRKREPARCER